MTVTTKPPESAELRGPDEYPQSIANVITYALGAAARYMLESAYADYRLTVSRETEDAARLAALCAYAGHIAPQRVAFAAQTGDPAACAIAALAALLLPDGVIMGASTPAPSNRVVRVAGTDTDRRTAELIDLSLPPSRARMDTGYVRHRLAESARANRTAVLAACERCGSVIDAVAALAGGDWPRVARLLHGSGGR